MHPIEGSPWHFKIHSYFYFLNCSKFSHLIFTAALNPSNTVYHNSFSSLIAKHSFKCMQKLKIICNWDVKWKYSKIKVLCHFFFFFCAIENEKLKHTAQKTTSHSTAINLMNQKKLFFCSLQSAWGLKHILSSVILFFFNCFISISSFLFYSVSSVTSWGFLWIFFFLMKYEWKLTSNYKKAIS